MKMLRTLFCTAMGLLTLGLPLSLDCVAGDPPTRVLVVTGGHAYETNHFAGMFWSNPEITVQSVVHPNALGEEKHVFEQIGALMRIEIAPQRAPRWRTWVRSASWRTERVRPELAPAG